MRERGLHGLLEGRLCCGHVMKRRNRGLFIGDMAMAWEGEAVGRGESNICLLPVFSVGSGCWLPVEVQEFGACLCWCMCLGLSFGVHGCAFMLGVEWKEG